MKEKYYSKDSIDIQAKTFQKEVDVYFKKKPWDLKPEKTVLLILDMQNFFLDKRSHAYIPSAAAIIPNIQELCSVLTDTGIDIIYTRHINTDTNSKNMGIWWRDILKRSDKLSEIYEDIYYNRSPVIIKSQYDAFYDTDLEKILKNNNKTQIIISGVMTHLCCETTARSAFIRGFEVFFGIDLTATYNKKFHSSSLINLSHGFAVPVLSDEIINKLYENKL